MLHGDANVGKAILRENGKQLFNKCLGNGHLETFFGKLEVERLDYSYRGRTPFVIVVSILLCCLFIHLRYVCNQPEKLRTMVLFSFCFFLSVPCLYLTFKMLFPECLRIFLFIFYLFLALFPYKIFFREIADLCQIYTYPPPSIVFGLDRYWVLIFYGIISMIIMFCCLWYRHNKQWVGELFKKEVGICGLLLILTVLQLIPRLDLNSPLAVFKGVHKDKELWGTNCTIDFFGFFAWCDVPQWTVPNGLFKGVNLDRFQLTKSSMRYLRDEHLPEEVIEQLKTLKHQEFLRQGEFLTVVETYIGKQQTVKYQETIVESALINSVRYQNLVSNRRSLGGYFYSLLEPFIHPYYASVILNGAFFYLMLIAAYSLARYLRLHYTIAMAFPLLLSGNYYQLLRVVDPSFSGLRLTFSILLLILGYRLQIFSLETSVVNKLLFCAVLACSALVYDPELKVGFIFFWGIFYIISHIRRNRTRAGVVLLHAIGYAVIPLVSQYSFKTLLRYFHVAESMGIDHGGAAHRINVLTRLPSLPGYLIHNFTDAILKLNHGIVEIVFRFSLASEYLELLGGFGVICLLCLLPIYIKGEKLSGIYALYLSCILIPVVASLTFSIPPAKAWDGFAARSGEFYPLLPLAQSIGFYHLAKFLCRWLPPWIKPKYILYFIVAFIFIFSYHNIL